MSNEKMIAEYKAFYVAPENQGYLKPNLWMAWQAATAVQSTKVAAQAERLQRQDLEISALKMCIDGELPLRDIITVHAAEIERLTQGLENERIRLAACGVVALSNTVGTVAQRLPRENQHWSASYGDVCSAVDREMDLREKLVARNAEVARLNGIIAAAPVRPTLTDAEIDGLWHSLPGIEIHNKAASEGKATTYALRITFARAILAQSPGQGADDARDAPGPVLTWQGRMGLCPDFQAPKEGWPSSTLAMLAEIADLRAALAKDAK